jgi:hypothetical protein
MLGRVDRRRVMRVLRRIVAGVQEFVSRCCSAAYQRFIQRKATRYTDTSAIG